MITRILLLVMALSVSAFAQVPPIEPGVSQELAKWRAARYSDVRYKLNLTLEKMSPVLKGTMEIRLQYAAEACAECPPRFIVLDWRKIRGHEEKSTISNVTLNGRVGTLENHPVAVAATPLLRKEGSFAYREQNEHLIFSDGVVMGENVITLDFTSPILTSGSAITRYVDKEDGSEYLYSLFVPSDASTAFPVFDQPDIKTRFDLFVKGPEDWRVISNSERTYLRLHDSVFSRKEAERLREPPGFALFKETLPISTYVFAFAAGPFERVEDPATRSVPPAVAGGFTRPIDKPSGGKPAFRTETGSGDSSHVGGSNPNIQPPATAGGTDIGSEVVAPGGNASVNERVKRPSDAPNSTTGDLDRLPNGRVSASDNSTSIYVRKSQSSKFKPHAAEVFRLNREAIKYFEEYFNYKFPWPKYDLVLIPEFPFGGMEHAGATFLRESSIIFPQEPTKNDHISRALLMFHEASHQWFGDTVTMRWFDDLWLKEGFATFTAYKALEKIMPEMNAWTVFYERIKQGAYATDSTKGTTPIYQEIKNLSAAKSAYGNIVYNKAPAFLRQAEFYLGEDNFRAAVRAFLKKHEFGNAGWEDLVREFQVASGNDVNTMKLWAEQWVTQRGLPIIRTGYSRLVSNNETYSYGLSQKPTPETNVGEVYRSWRLFFNLFAKFPNGEIQIKRQFLDFEGEEPWRKDLPNLQLPVFVFPNYQDYGYGIFLLDDKSRDYVLKNIQNEKDPFLRSMMWGALWDSVREGELDPRQFVELVVKVLSTTPAAKPASPPIQEGSLVRDDESTTALLLSRVGTAMNYYIDEAGTQAPSPASAQRAETASAAKSVRRPADTVQAGSLRSRVEDMLIERMQKAETLGQRITYYRAFLNIASSENARKVLKGMLTSQLTTPSAEAAITPPAKGGESRAKTGAGKEDAGNGAGVPLRTKDKFDIVTKLLILNDPDAPKLLAELEKTETGDDAKRYAYAAKAGIPTAENKAKYWNDFVNNKEISESWIEAAFGPWNSIKHSELTLPYLERALKELPNHKRNRKIFFVNGWLGAFIGGQRSEEALAIVNKVLADNPGLDNDLRLKILENVDVIERAVEIRKKY